MIKVHHHALINPMLKQRNVRNWDQIVLMRPTEIVRCERAISGKNESRALIFLGCQIKNNLHFRIKIYFFWKGQKPFLFCPTASVCLFLSVLCKYPLKKHVRWISNHFILQVFLWKQLVDLSFKQHTNKFILKINILHIPSPGAVFFQQLTHPCCKPVAI